MSTKLKSILGMAAVALFVTACSSTTVVAREERPVAETASEPSVDDASSTLDEEDDREPAVSDEDDSAADQGDQEGADDGDAEDEDAVDLEAIEGLGLGGAEQIEGLLTDCEDGNDLACDILFQISDFDSDEEAAALTCGGREESTVDFCTEGIDGDPDSLAFDVNSEGVEAVVDQCVDDGDMTACDFLYYRSPVESDLEEIGSTCGGRVPVAVPDCRTFLTEES